MIDDKTYLETIKTFALFVLELQTDLSALAKAIHDRGDLTKGQFEHAQKQTREMNRARRERIEKLGLTDLGDFLKEYSGPLQ